MAINDINRIKKSLRTHLEDLHIILTERGVNIDTQLYNDTTLALLETESAIDLAIFKHNKRIQEHLDKYGTPNTVVD